MPRWPKHKPRTGVDEYGRTVLWYKAASGDVAAIHAEISAGIDPNLGDDVGYTPLHVAVQNGHIQAVDALLAAGANPNSTDKHGNGPLWTAVLTTRINQENIIVSLLRSGADPNSLNIHDRSPAQMANNMGGIPAQVFSRGGNSA